MPMCLCRTLGGHKLTDIGKVLGLKKSSSMSPACLSMKGRIKTEKRLAIRARSIEELLIGQQQTCLLMGDTFPVSSCQVVFSVACYRLLASRKRRIIK